ncbi:MAG: thioesterase domain-containing protein, partial [Chloroflexota bacterium]
ASRDGAQPSAGELRRWLAERLPEHMVPTAYVALDALPATATGKLDRRALPPPPDGRPFGADAYVAPRSAIQATLAALWSEVLGVDVVGAKDDFFALGGHSLHAAHLFTRVHEAYGVTLPLSTLLQCPTVEQLAGEIERRAPGTPHSSIVPIQPAGARPPFFAIHPMGGDVLLYRDLGRLLGPDQPLYGIRARGLDGNQEPHTDIEVMAADYVDQLRTMQPQGPYFLGGLSAGAVIAFEMARQLTTGGQQVALLASFDGRAVRSGYDEILWTWTWLACFAQNLAYFPAQCRHRLAELPPDDRLPAVRRAVLKNLDDLLRATLCPYGYAGLYRRLYDALGLEGRTQARLSIDDAVSPSERKTETTHALAIKRYVPGVYSGRLTVFRARAQPLFCSFDPTLGWDKLAAGGVAVKVVSGHHLSMIQPPYVATLARALRAAMDEALARGEGR